MRAELTAARVSRQRHHRWSTSIRDESSTIVLEYPIIDWFIIYWIHSDINFDREISLRTAFNFLCVFVAVGAGVFEGASGIWCGLQRCDFGLSSPLQCNAAQSFYKIDWFVPIQIEGMNFSFDKFNDPFRVFLPEGSVRKKIEKEYWQQHAAWYRADWSIREEHQIERW